MAQTLRPGLFKKPPKLPNRVLEQKASTGAKQRSSRRNGQFCRTLSTLCMTTKTPVTSKTTVSQRIHILRRCCCIEQRDARAADTVSVQDQRLQKDTLQKVHQQPSDTEWIVAMATERERERAKHSDDNRSTNDGKNQNTDNSQSVHIPPRQL